MRYRGDPLVGARGLQKCPNYKMWRGQNGWHPPYSSNFFVEAPQEDTFRGIGGIFEFHPRSQDNELFVAHFRVFLDPPKGSKMSTNAPIFQLLRRNSKIPPMPLKVPSWGASTKKLSQFGPGVRAVGMCHLFWIIHILWFGHFWIPILSRF